MGEILEKVKELAAAAPDQGYLNELDLVQNMRRMTALANQIVVEFSKVEPSMTTIYELRDDYENLEERTLTIVEKYKSDIENFNQEMQIIINNLRSQSDEIMENIEELLQIGENFGSISEEINHLLSMSDQVIQMEAEIEELKAGLGIVEVTPGTDTWVEPANRKKGKFYAEIRNAMVFDRDPVKHTEADPTIMDHKGPTVEKFVLAPHDGGVFQAGKTETITSITAEIKAQADHKIASAILYDGDEILAVFDWSKNNPMLAQAQIAFTPNGGIVASGTRQFKIRAFDETGASDEYFSKEIKFVHPFYHGSLPAQTTEVTATMIKTRIEGQFIKPTVIEKFTGTHNFIFTYESGTDILMYPKEYGDLESMTTLEGDELEKHTKTVIEDFDTEGVPYIAYHTSGATFTQTDQQMQVKFPDPEPAAPTGYAKIKPLAFAYLATGAVQSITGIEVTVSTAAAKIKEIRVLDGNKVVGNLNSNNGLAGDFQTGTATITWDEIKITGQKGYTIEVEDNDGRVGKFTSSYINFMSPTYFGFIYKNSAQQFNLPMEDSALRKDLKAALPGMKQMFPKPIWFIKESQGNVPVTGDAAFTHDLICYPTEYGQVARITDGDGTNRLSEYKTQRVNVDGVDCYVMVGPAPTALKDPADKGAYNRTFHFK